MRGALGAMLVALISPWRCTGHPPPVHEIETLTISPHAPPSGPGGASRSLRVADDPAAAALLRALEECRGPEIAKFLPSYSVMARARDGSEPRFLVRGHFVKLDGVAYSCDENIESLLVQALGTETERPRRW